MFGISGQFSDYRGPGLCQSVLLQSRSRSAIGRAALFLDSAVPNDTHLYLSITLGQADVHNVFLKSDAYRVIG